MASTKDYAAFIADQLSGLDGITLRPMMGEYLLCHREKIPGGIYDNRLLVKPTPTARALLPHAPEELPYPGAKPMLLVEDVDDRDFLTRLFTAIYPELPLPARKRKPLP